MAYSKGIDMETRALILVLWTMCSLCATQKVDYGPECEYKGDMGDISVENCIAKMEADGDLDNCPGVIYGPGTLFRQRGETPFWIDIKNPSRGKYPENLTYKILNMPDIDQPENLTQIPGCDSMKLNEPRECVLQPIKENEFNWIYLPLLNDPDFSYCSYYIDEVNGFCDGANHDTPCYELKNGRYQLRVKPNDPIDSTPEPPSLMKFCFFSMPKRYIDVNTNRGDFFIQSITSEGKGENVRILLGDKKVKCTIVERQNSEVTHKLARDFRNESSDFVCFLLARAMKNNIWMTENAACLEFELEENIPLKISLAVVFSVLALAAVLAARQLYKRHIDWFSSIDGEFKKSLAIDLNNCPDDDERQNQIEEIFFEITADKKSENSCQTNEEQIENLSTDRETSSSRSGISFEEIYDEGRRCHRPTQQECGPNEELPASMACPHVLTGQCTYVDYSSEKCLDRDTEDGQENLDKNALAQEDDSNRPTTKIQKDSGYSRKYKKHNPHIESSTNQQDVPEVMVPCNYIQK